MLHNPNGISFSKCSQEKLMVAICSGWAPSTLRGYSRTVSAFLVFCNEENIHLKHQFPADKLFSAHLQQVGWADLQEQQQGTR
jgi:hypothetical protein